MHFVFLFFFIIIISCPLDLFHVSFLPEYPQEKKKKKKTIILVQNSCRY